MQEREERIKKQNAAKQQGSKSSGTSIYLFSQQKGEDLELTHETFILSRRSLWKPGR